MGSNFTAQRCRSAENMLRPATMSKKRGSTMPVILEIIQKDLVAKTS
jgi:hypothetical protein